jgi:hypothetical protein
LAAAKHTDLFAFDLDGTLVHRLPSGERDIPPELLAVIQELSTRAHIIVATGRRYRAALVDIKKMPPMPFHIVHNGLVIKDSAGKTVERGSLDHETAVNVARLLESHGFDSFFVSDGFEYEVDYSYTEAALARSEAVQAISRRPYQKGRLLKTVEDILVRKEVPILEVATVGRYEDLLQLKAKLADVLPSHLRSVVVRNTGYLSVAAMEIFEKGHSKGQAVDFVKQRLGASRVISVGDDGNDVEMIESANIGVVMDHAEPHIKELSAHHVQGPEGLAKFLREYLSQ